jgi:hypothetical protein
VIAARRAALDDHTTLLSLDKTADLLGRNRSRLHSMRGNTLRFLSLARDKASRREASDDEVAVGRRLADVFDEMPLTAGHAGMAARSPGRRGSG